MNRIYKKQIKKIDETLKILNNIEINYEKFDEARLKTILKDLVNGYKATLEGLKHSYIKELK